MMHHARLYAWFNNPIIAHAWGLCCDWNQVALLNFRAIQYDSKECLKATTNSCWVLKQVLWYEHRTWWFKVANHKQTFWLAMLIQ